MTPLMKAPARQLKCSVMNHSIISCLNTDHKKSIEKVFDRVYLPARKPDTREGDQGYELRDPVTRNHEIGLSARK